MTSPNPFVRYGTIASDERFVGRELERASLRRRLYEARSSAALIGLTRMGKSSLANEILKEAPSGTRAGWVSIAEVRSGAEALKDILAICPQDSVLNTTFTAGAARTAPQRSPFTIFTGGSATYSCGWARRGAIW